MALACGRCRALAFLSVLPGCASVAAALAAETRNESLVLHNATVYTMSEKVPYASALCIRDGRVEAVGSNTSSLLEECASGGNKVHTVNLHGAVVVPGLTDSHAHLNMEAARRTAADLSEATSAQAAAEAAVAFAQRRPDLVNASGGWVRGFGWDQTRWPGSAFPTRQILDAVFPNTPACMEQLSGHAIWANSKALAIAAADIPAHGDIPGGHIERDSHGQPTGILSDNAADLVLKHIPPISDAKADAVLTEVLHDCAAHGLTGVHDLDSLSSDVELLKKRHARGDLLLRVYAMRNGAQDSPDEPIIKTEDGLLTVQGVKFFADGAMGSWSAAMLRPYDDRPNTTGTLVYSNQSDLRAIAKLWASKGYQVAAHAIGDAANREVLNVYEDLLTSPGAPSDARWRVEHAQILSAEDLSRFAKLGVIPSMQPSHCAADLPYALQRLGWDRASRSYAWMSLLETGVRALPFGSDFPTAGSIPPLLGLHAAVTRETPEGVPAGGWFPSQRVTRVQALKGYTVEAAFASFREHELGILAPGYRADLTIFDRDPMTVDAPDILGLKVVATVVGGRVVYAANSSSPLARFAEPSSVPRLSEEAASASTAGSSARLAFWWQKYVHEMNEDRRPSISVSQAPGAVWI